MSFIHLRIDMQAKVANIFLPQHWELLKKKTVAASELFNKASIPTIHVLYMPAQYSSFFGTYADMKANSKLWIRDQELPTSPVRDHELVAIKTTFSAHTIEGLQHYLKEKGVKTIFLSGFTEGSEDSSEHQQSQCCVRATAKNFKALGYNVVVVSDATDGYLPNFYKGSGLQAFEKRRQDFAKMGVLMMPTCAVPGHLKLA